jgi:hypothetical protein
MLCVTRRVRSWLRLPLLLTLVGLAIPFWGQDSVAFKKKDPDITLLSIRRLAAALLGPSPFSLSSPAYPGFLPRSTGNERVCGFQ